MRMFVSQTTKPIRPVRHAHTGMLLSSGILWIQSDTMNQRNTWVAFFFLFGLAVQAQEVITVFVSSRANNSVKTYDPDGNYLGNFVSPGKGGLSGTEDILFHPDGRVLVTGFQNTTIKAYDGETMDYLGDFSSGYSLATPSKMSIGPDSLIYVTQWGATQNKVVRFDLDGNFVDEFTSVGVPNGLGHIWDENGDFYIAQYGNGGNGIIHRFGPDGQDKGTFINSAIIQGPTNIWWGPGGDLYITDWTVGNAVRYSATGIYKGVWATGMVNPEGVATLPNGDVLIGDWGVDAVHRFDSLGTYLGYFNTAGGLADPNSVRLRKNAISSTQDPLFSKNQVSWRGPDIHGAYVLRWDLDQPATIHTRIVNGLGQCMEVLQDHEKVSGVQEVLWTPDASWPAGIYYVQVRSSAAFRSIPFSIH